VSLIIIPLTLRFYIMKHSALVYFLLIQCLLWSQAAAAVDFIYLIKEQAYEQFGNSAPDQLKGWSFATGVQGDALLTAASVTLPGDVEPTPMAGEPGGYELDAGGYATQAELDATYPDGTYALSFTDNGVPGNLGPYTLSGGTYPNVPHLTNVLEFQDSDHSQDFELTWNAFSGSSAGDQVLLQIFDDATGEDIFGEFLDASATSIIVPGGTLELDRYYEVAIVFIGKTDAVDTEGVIIGYISRTEFRLSTHTSDTGLLLYKWRGQEQTGPGQYGDADYRVLSTVTGASRTIDSAQLVVGLGNPQDMNPFGQNGRILVTPFGPKETMDADYPAGEYSFIVTEDAIPTNYGPYPLPDDAYPEPPEVLNFAEMANVDATQSQAITWNPAPAGTSLIQVRILDGANAFVWGQSLDPEVSSVQVPENTLQPDTTYQLIIRFWAPAYTNEKPPTALGYISAISVPLSTFQDGGGTTLDLAYVLKERGFSQESNGIATTPDSWRMNAGLSGSADISSASFIHPGGTALLDGSEGDFDLDGPRYPSKTDLDLAYPSGEYAISYTGESGTELVGSFLISDDLYPTVPHLQNVADLDSHPFDQPFELTWNTFDTAVEGDLLVLEIYDESNDEEVISAFLDPFATSLAIPANELADDRYYEISLIFVKKVAAFSSPEIAFGYMSRTQFRLSTHTSDTSIVAYKTHMQTQTSPTELEDNGYRPLVVLTGYSRTVSYAEVQTPTSLFSLNSFAPNRFIYATPFGPKEIMDLEFPAGEYGFGVVEDDVSIGYGPYAISADAYSEPVIIQNFNELQEIDPTVDQTVELNAAPAGVTGIGFQIRDADFRLVWSTGAPPESTSLVIPANTLEKSADYSFTVTFWVETDGSDAPQVIVGFGSITRMFFKTAAYSSEYLAWLSQYFTEEEIGNPDIVGEGADADGDKLGNYFEFKAGFDPTDNQSTLNVEFSFNPTQTLTVGPVADDLSWEVQTSTTLSDWSVVAPELISVSNEEMQIDLSGFLPDAFFRLVLNE
jgi:hypothetical protein